MSEDTDFAAAPEITSILDLFSTDRVAEEDGKWFNDYFGDRAPGNDIKLRGFGSKASLKVHRRLQVQYHHLVQSDGTLPFEAQQKILTLQLAEAIIMDWRGPIWKDRAGQPMKCTPENALLVLAASAVRNRVITTAGDLDNFRASVTLDATKN